MEKNINIDWENLSFKYIKTDLRYVSKRADGKWDEGKLVEDNTLTISEGSPALHYGQQCFEGMKAYRRKDGTIQLFRPDQNAKRINDSCRRILMPEIPEDKFIDACIQLLRTKPMSRHMEPAAPYIRPLVIGVGDNIGVKPASEYIFSIFCYR